MRASKKPDPCVCAPEMPTGKPSWQAESLRYDFVASLRLLAWFRGAAARLGIRDVGLVIGILDHDFRRSEDLRLCHGVVQGREPELACAPVPLLHLHAANPEGRVF